MSLLLEIMIMFVKFSTFSFGGGYVMIPAMLRELERYNLVSPSQVTDVVAIASMSPGPVAINAAVGVGYVVDSLQGTLAAVLGILIPNCAIVILAASFFFKIYKSKYVISAFYGLRPVVTGIILYAAVSFALKNGIIEATSEKLIKNGYNIFLGKYHIFEVKSILLIIIAFIVLLKTKVHPVLVIALSGIIGTIIFRS